MLQQASVLTDQLMASVAPAVATAGMQLWQGLALMVVVWTGAQMALSGHGVNMAAVVRMVIGLSIPLGMLRFYTAPLPGTGRSVPDLITGMGDWLQGMIVADAGTAMLEQLGLATGAWRAQFAESRGLDEATPKGSEGHARLALVAAARPLGIFRKRKTRLGATDCGGSACKRTRYADAAGPAEWPGSLPVMKIWSGAAIWGRCSERIRLQERDLEAFGAVRATGVRAATLAGLSSYTDRAAPATAPNARQTGHEPGR